MSNTTNHLAKQSVIVFGTRIFILVSTLAAGIIISRVLGPDGRGAYAFLILIPTLMLRLGNLGLGGALIYFHGQKKYSLSTLISNVSALSLGISLLLLLIFAVLFPFINSSFSTRLAITPTLMWISVFTLPFQLYSFFLSHALLAEGKIKIYSLVGELLPALVNLAGAIFFVVVLRYNVSGTIIAFASSAIIPFIWLSYHYRSSVKLSLAQPGVILELLHYGMRNYATTLFDFINYRIDILILGAFLSSVAIGIYTVAVSIAELLWYIPNSIATVIFPNISQSSQVSATEITAKSLRVNSILIFVLSIGIIITARPVIALLYGTQFSTALEPLFILLPGIFFLSYSRILNSYVNGIGHPGMASLVSGLVALINLGLNLYLIPKMGINGAALSSTISYTLSGIFMILVFKRFHVSENNTGLRPQKSDFLLIFEGIRSILNSLQIFKRKPI